MPPRRRRPVLLTGLVDNGFIVVPDALDRRVLQSARRRVGEVAAEGRPGGCERRNNVLVPLRWNDALVQLLLGHAALIERVRSVTDATDLKWISGYVSVRPPKTGALEWHQDWWCWNHAVALDTRAPQVAVLVYLDDVTVENAALRSWRDRTDAAPHCTPRSRNATPHRAATKDSLTIPTPRPSRFTPATQWSSTIACSTRPHPIPLTRGATASFSPSLRGGQSYPPTSGVTSSLTSRSHGLTNVYCDPVDTLPCSRPSTVPVSTSS